MNTSCKTITASIASLLLILLTTLASAQCTLPTTGNAILRQPDLYQLVGNNDGAYDTPNGVQDAAGGNTLSNGNWLNRGIVNLVRNGDFSLPGATTYEAMANGTGTNGQLPVTLASVPNWTITGNSSLAYPYYCLYLLSPSAYSVTGFGATRSNLYVGNSSYATSTEAPVFDHGYATNSNTVNPYLVPGGITQGFGMATGYPIAVHQTISTTPGNIYRLHFFISGENTSWTENWLMGMEITGYNRAILMVPGSINIIRYEFEFKAKADTTTLKFINWGHSISGGAEFFIDDIIVNAVPPVCAVVPVKLELFEVSKQVNAVNLFWQTSFEQNSHHFEIENSNDGSNWVNLGSVTAAGNSNIKKQYRFTHNNPQSGYNYYRLKQVDANGKFTYSEIRRIFIDEKDQPVIIYNSYTRCIAIPSYSTGIAAASLFSADGKKIQELGENTNITAYPSGMYLIRVIDKKGNAFFKKVIKN